MGSLFDGIGGFPLAAVHNGIIPVWASEIEAFPIEVTKLRFPDMVHVGDITKLNGAELPPVDIICGGSPCQDLSVAGARAGLAGERSGLFMEQVRLVKEMRNADIQRGRAALDIRPRFMVWENVPGAVSSGTPKGAMLSETAIITNVNDIGDYYALNESDTLLIARPLYHCAVLTGEFLTALTKGTRILFCSDIFNPSQLLSLMKDNSVTAFGSTPTVLRTLARFAKMQGAPTLEHLVISGECLSENVARTIRDAFPKTSIYHVYGLTEASPRVAFLPPDQFDQFPENVGQPLNSVQLQIRNSDGTQAPNGTEGILWVRGKNVMQGYYKNLGKTKATLQKGWLCTGDIAVIESNGWLKIKGRNDDLIIRSGMNIYPAEIEGELKQDPRTRDVLIYKVENEKLGTQIGLKISGEFQDEREVREMCSSLLTPYQMPSLIELVARLPHNGSGKTVRKHD